MIKHILPFLTTTALFILPTIAHAQTYQATNRTPVADSTLGTQVSGTGNNFNITGGLNRGQSLFHSFTDFSVPTGGAANFTNPTGNRDIISRVTGNLFSDINGLVNSNGANFFLINPNGIVFGTNAQLNVGRAFMASTANGINLVDGSGRAITFGTNLNGDAPLLTIAPNVLFNVSALNFAGRNGQISNFGTLQTTNPNQYIGLIGGNVSMNGGKVIAPGGRIELGGLAAPGSISWNQNKLTFPGGVTRSNVTLTNGSSVSVAGSGGGGVAVNAENLNVLNGSEIAAGISENAPNSQAGDIDLNVAKNIEVGGTSPSTIENAISPDGTGNGGNINIKTQKLNITNGGQVRADNRGIGVGGNIVIKADEINVLEAQGVNRSTISNINTDVLNSPQNNAPNLNRRGGNITIDTRLLKVVNKSYISADTEGRGKAGNVSIKAANIEVRGGSISSNTLGGQSDAGNLTIVADTVRNLDGGEINAATYAGGNAGKLMITTNLLEIKKAGVSTTTYGGSGNAGELTVNANNIIIDGERPRPNTTTSTPSGLFAQVNSGGRGNGGKLTVNTQRLSVSNGGKVQAASFGQGDGGNISIKADEIDVFNSPGVTTKQLTNINTGISFDPAGNVDSQGRPIYARGKSGNLTIETRRLSIRNGAAVTSDTRGIGDAGRVSINASELVEISGKNSRLSVGVTRSDAVGNAGELNVNTKRLIINDRGYISTSSAGKGVAGKLQIRAKEIQINNSGEITAKTASGKGGNIQLNVSDYLLMGQNSQISTTAGTAQQGGDGGNITIISPLIVAIPLKSNNDITANAYTGKGGTVTISSDGLFGIQYRPKGQESPFTNDITASSTFGKSGSVNIKTPGTDPGRDSTILPTVPKDISNQFSHVCSDTYRQNKLIVTGRGGLQPVADDPLTSDVVWQDSRAAIRPPATNKATNHREQLPPPAIGWVFDGKGKVTLISAGTYNLPIGTSVVCPKD